MTQHDMTDNNSLSILSLNINGLNENKKRNNLFKKLSNKNIDIILLQETHSTKQITEKWQKEWSGKSFWNSGEKTKFSGVAILIKNNLKIQINTINQDKQGRILSLNLTFEKQNYQILNIYAPTRNSKKLKFYKHLHKYISINDKVILGGDFNNVEDLLLDRRGGNPNNTHLLGMQYLQKIKQRYNLTDIWQKQNPDKQLFTFHNNNKLIHSRLDRIYIPKNQKIINVNIIPNNLSDHDAMQVIISVKKKNIYSQGYWRLNTSIIKQKQFQKLFKKFWNDWLIQKKNYDTLNQWWESEKLYFKTMAIIFSTEKNKKIKQQLTKLTQTILKEKKNTTKLI